MELKFVGCDPEVFVADGSGIIPGIGLIGGSKHEPMQVDKGALQEDNVLAEFNIIPAATEDDFVTNINHVMQQLMYRIAPLEMRILSSHRFDKEVLEKAGPKAMEFGCDVDYNAWSMQPNRRPDPTTNLRTAGGHVHVSFDSDDETMAYKVGAMMDYYLGVPSVLLDSDQERRQMYGKAGAIRPKDYGVEYRTLSNFWLQSDKLMRWVFRNAKEAVENVDHVFNFRKLFPADDVQNVINTGNTRRAEKIITSLNIPMPS